MFGAGVDCLLELSSRVVSCVPPRSALPPPVHVHAHVPLTCACPACRVLALLSCPTCRITGLLLILIIIIQPSVQPHICTSLSILTSPLTIFIQPSLYNHVSAFLCRSPPTWLPCLTSGQHASLKSWTMCTRVRTQPSLRRRWLGIYRRCGCCTTCEVHRLVKHTAQGNAQTRGSVGGKTNTPPVWYQMLCGIRRCGS